MQETDKECEGQMIMLSKHKSDEVISNPQKELEKAVSIPKLSEHLEDIKLSSSQDESDSFSTPGFLLWFSGNDFFSKVAEKAKNSMDSMITTLDPQMKEYLCKILIEYH